MIKAFSNINKIIKKIIIENWMQHILFVW